MLYIITHSYSLISRAKSKDPLKSPTWVQDKGQPQIKTKKKHSFVKMSTSIVDEEKFAKDLIKPRKNSTNFLSMNSIAHRVKQSESDD